MIDTTIIRRSRLDERQKQRRLALIKERYRKLVLEPRRRIQFEIAAEFGDDLDFPPNN